MRTGTVAAAIALALPTLLCAQAPLPAETQITAAVGPLPAQFRADATVFGYAAGKTGLVTLRQGKNTFICLADDPSDERFHVACYHDSLEPFMLRGRELRAQGVTNVDSARYAEIDNGKLKMAKGPAALYSLTAAGKPAADGTSPNPRSLYVIYVPFATAETTGLPTRPEGNSPWLMMPGTAKAHVMFTPRM
ncbi:MAG: hypothetical protein ACRENP_24130 [Longimicrobiales bacterium]